MGDKLEATFHGVSPETMALMFGGQVPTYQSPEQSLLVTYTDTVSGRPERPNLRKARWWDRAGKRANELAMQAYSYELTAWEMAGRPDVEVEKRIYVPRASVTQRG